MARGLVNALQLALGAVEGAASGYGAKQESVRRKQIEDEALRRQRELDRRQAEQDLFTMYEKAGYGFDPVRTTPDATARGVTALEAPTLPAGLEPSVMGKSLAKATQAGVGVTGKPTGMLDTPISLALDTTRRQQLERGAALQPASREQRITMGGMQMGLVSPEEVGRRKTEAQVEAYRQQRDIDVQTDTAKKTAEREFENQQAEGLATIYQTAYADKNGNPLSRDKALAAARNKKDPIDMGFLPKPMSESERQSVAARWSELALSREKFNFDKEQGPKKGGSTDPIQMRIRSGMNEMLLANKGMEDFEQKFKAGKVNITVGQRVLQKLATDFANEKTPIDKIMSSSAYSALAKSNPDLVEYMRNVDAFAEGETMISSRPSNFRTKMAQFLSGVAADSPVEVVNRVQQRRRGLLTPLVQGYYEGDWSKAMQGASVEGQAPTGTPAPAKSAAEAWLDANPQRQGETDAAYKARYQAAQRGGVQ